MAPMCVRVSRQLLPVKITYFTLFAAVGILLPYIAVYMRQLGLSPTESAIILSVSTILTAVIRMVIGMITDKYRIHVVVLIVCCILSGLLHLSLLFVPRDSHTAVEDVDHNSSRSNVSCVSVSESELVICGITIPNLSFNSVVKPPTKHFEIANGSISSSAGCELDCCDENFLTDDLREVNFSRVAQNVCTVHSLMNSSVHTIEPNQSQCMVYRREGNSTISIQKLSNICRLINKQSCSIDCRNLTEHEEDSAAVELSKFGTTFWIFFILYLAASSSFSPVISIVDALSYACLGDRRLNFGRQRYWGSIGFGLFGVVSSMIMDVLQTSTADKNYMYSFVLFVGFLFATALSVYHIEGSVEVIAGSLMANVGKIFRNPELDLLMLTAFISGYLCGAQEGFLFWYLQSLGGPQILMGFCGLVQCTIEIFVIFYSGHIVVKYGTMVCLCAVFCAFSLRFLLYSFLMNPWCVLSIEPLHSVCYGLFYPAMTIRASELTPAGMHGTMQSLLGALYMSVGRAVGVAVGGLLYEKAGPRTMFRSFSGVSFVYVFVLLIYIIVTRHRKSSKPTGDVDAAIVADGEDKMTVAEALTPIEPLAPDGEAGQTRGKKLEDPCTGSSGVEVSSLLRRDDSTS